MKRIDDIAQAAETVAIKALSFIAADPERLGRFLAETGLGPSTLRAAAADPQFLAGVLDFILRDDAMVVAFAADAELDPIHVKAARDVLGEPPRRQ